MAAPQIWTNQGTEWIYRCAARRIVTWGEDVGIENLGDITANMPAQFEELFPAVEAFTAAKTGRVHEWTAELKTLFLTQRWAGLRILDALTFPRTKMEAPRDLQFLPGPFLSY